MDQTFKRKPYRVAKAVRAIARLILPPLFNIHFVYADDLAAIQPPYFLFGNHTSFLDPFIMEIGARDHINFVANDEYFRNPLLNFLLGLAGAVPKTKFVTDVECVKRIFKLRDAGDVIGIYPEGGRTWPGETQPLLFSMSKLAKRFELPVVGAVTRGGSLSFPRWGARFRKGRVNVEYGVCLTKDMVRQMTAAEIHAHMTRYFAHNETEWNKKHKFKFKGKRLAENLGYFIYACPKCGAFESMTAHDDLYECTCGYRVRYDECGRLENASGEVFYEDLITWDKAQRAMMEQRAAALKDDETLLTRTPATLSCGKWRERKLAQIASGALTLTKDALLFNGSDHVFPLQEILGVTVNHKNVLDFYIGTTRYSVQFDDILASGYIWEEAIKALQRQ